MTKWPAAHRAAARAKPKPIRGRHVTEAFVAGRWRFIDADTFRHLEIEVGTLGHCLELREKAIVGAG